MMIPTRSSGPWVVLVLFAWIVTATDARAQPDQSRYEALARQCAIELPWLFDLTAAERVASEQGKQILIYVRSVNARAGYESARTTLEAAGVPLADDGYRKDLLFRACVLADRGVQDVIREQFVPVCLTYHFETHGKGRGDADWSFAGIHGGEGLAIDPDVGARAKGSLRLDRAGTFLQPLVRPAMKPGTYRLQARVRTRDVQGDAGVRVLWLEEGSRTQTSGMAALSDQVEEVGGAAWRRATFDLTLKAAPINILVMPTLRGSGTAWFDDLELRLVVEGEAVGENLLRNGGIDADANQGDPLKALGESATETVTPALLLVSDSRVVSKLHRIGVMSPDHVESWLRASSNRSAKAAGADEPGEGGLLHAQRRLREGAWSAALATLAVLRTEEGVLEGQFWEGLCLHRLGQKAEARERWMQAVGPTRWGRRAAASVLPRGPHPALALSERRWVGGTDAPTSEHPASFDGMQALQILLELQDEDGGFSDHRAAVDGDGMSGPWKPAYTALAARAIAAWMPEDSGLRVRAREALVRSRGFLAAWSRSKPRGRLGAFNHPYALHALLQLEDLDSAQRVADALLSEQAPDGSWSVYGPDRPTSFNTALAILALVAARDAKLDVNPAAIDAACAALERMRSGKDLFPYSPKVGHEWKTTEFGSIARDPLCEHALLRAGRGDASKLMDALERFLRFHEELRTPTKHYSSDFNQRGHGSYFFLFGICNALEAAALSPPLRPRVEATVRAAMLAAAEKDSSAVDHAMYGRAYGTAMALLILAPR